MRTNSGAGECVDTHMCICDSFVAVSRITMYQLYIDFSRAMSECLNSGHLNRKTFCYFVVQSSTHPEKLTSVVQREPRLS